MERFLEALSLDRMIQEFLLEIEQHFEEWYPKEACGIIAVVKGKPVWFPCKNIAKTNDTFVFDSTEYMKIAQKCDIIGIVHSHPDGSSTPSINDIKYCNSTGLIYYIFSYPDMELYTLHPEREDKPLYGRLYEFGVQDCFEAARDYYLKEGLDIPNRIPFEEKWWLKDINYFSEEYIRTWNFKKVDEMKKGDFLTFSVFSDIPNHCGVYLGDDIFFHHAVNRLSCKENLFPQWKQHLTGIYRYAP